MERNRIKKIVKDKSDLCIWMQADVVRQKTCKIDYNCKTCNFDKVMRRVSKKNRQIREQSGIPKGKCGKIVYWKDRLRELPTWKRPCIHHMKARIEFRACTNDYRCGDCEFDQYFYDQYTVHTVVRPVDLLDIEGFKIPHGYYLHPGHAWVKVEEGSEVRIGLDDFALRLLGPFDQLEAPLIGKEVKQGDTDISMNRGQHKARVLSPVSGVVTAINHRLREKVNLANHDPYSEGWVMRVHTHSLRQDLKKLMIGREAGDYVGKEINQLHKVIEEKAGPLAADGGFLTDDIYGKVPQLGWKKLTKLFLHT